MQTLLAPDSLICVDPARVDQFWPHVRNRLKIAIDRTRLSDFDLFEADVLKGNQLLWLAISDHIEAVATTRLCKANGRKVCELTACEGHQRNRWMALFAQIEKYAKDEECSSMRILGRKGWERVLDGYRVEHVILEKQL